MNLKLLNLQKKKTKYLSCLGVHSDQNSNHKKDLQKSTPGMKTFPSVQSFLPGKKEARIFECLIFDSSTFFGAYRWNIAKSSFVFGKQLNWGMQSCFNKSKSGSTAGLRIEHVVIIDAKAFSCLWSLKNNLLPAFSTPKTSSVEIKKQDFVPQ